MTRLSTSIFIILSAAVDIVSCLHYDLSRQVIRRENCFE
jgi:hypothetical protein